MPHIEFLKLRPWEGAEAQKRLIVPIRLLPGHCPVITRWIAITGATSAGKTTLIRALEDLGFTVIHEVARAYLEDEVSKGRTVADVRADDYRFRNEVFNLTLAEEKQNLHRAHELIFLDRSAADSISFFRGSGYDPHKVVQRMESYRYDKVFQCNPLPFVNDGIRTPNEERRAFLDAAFERDYRALGYYPIRVPHLSVNDRVRFVLEHCHIRRPEHSFEI